MTQEDEDRDTMRRDFERGMYERELKEDHVKMEPIILEADVNRDQAAFLREVLPKNFHHFFDSLCKTALSRPPESERAEQPSELADECERESAIARDLTASDLLQRAANALRRPPAQEVQLIASSLTRKGE